jgi:hypothetical protein
MFPLFPKILNTPTMGCALFKTQISKAFQNVLEPEIPETTETLETPGSFNSFYKEMSLLLHLDTKFAEQTFGCNLTVFFLSEPIVLPSDVHEWHISIPHATIPMSHWVITEETKCCT